MGPKSANARGSDPGDDSTQHLESPYHRGLTPINRITGV